MGYTVEISLLTTHSILYWSHRYNHFFVEDVEGECGRAVERPVDELGDVTVGNDLDLEVELGEEDFCFCKSIILRDLDGSIDSNRKDTIMIVIV